MTLTQEKQANRDMLAFGQSCRIVKFANEEHLLLNPKSHWRPCDGETGFINGLPHSQGALVATDGVLCWIRRLDGSLFQGHLQWFVKVKQEREDSPKAKVRAARHDRIVEEYA